MVMKHKDGTLYSCLTGLAFEGPPKGTRLRPVPTLVSDWGFWLKHYPGSVAYQMYDKYQPVELPVAENEDSKKTRPTPDGRLAAEVMVLGVAVGQDARAFPLEGTGEAGAGRGPLGQRDHGCAVGERDEDGCRLPTGRHTGREG